MALTCIILLFFHPGDSGITETVKYGGTVLDEGTEWLRSPVSYVFHLFEGTCFTNQAEIIGQCCSGGWHAIRDSCTKTHEHGKRKLLVLLALMPV